VPLQARKNFSRQRSEATIFSIGARFSASVAKKATTDIVTSHCRFGPLQLIA
jgi:hypothetical protein